MTKEELSQLIDLRNEIEELSYKIEEIRLRRGRNAVVHDKVQASSRDFPYIQTSVTIEGCQYEYDGKKQKALADKQRLYEQRKEECERLEIRITKYINRIRQSRTRRIFEAKYMDGKTWAQIGEMCNCDRTTAAKMVSDYLKKHRE